MRFLYYVLTRLLIIALLAASVLGMLVHFPLESEWFNPVRQFGQWLVERVLPTPLSLFWFWFGLFWAVVAIGALATALRKRTGGIAVGVEGGQIVILDSAVRKFLREALKSVPAFDLRRIEIYSRRNRLYIDLYAVVRTQTELPQLENTVISQVKEALRHELGIEQEAFVHLYVTDFTTAEQDLVYKRNIDQEEGSPTEQGSPRRPEGETLAFAWATEEPELAPLPLGEEKNDRDEKESAESTPEERRGSFWSRFRRKKETGKEPSTEFPANETSSEPPQSESSQQAEKDEDSRG